MLHKTNHVNQGAFAKRAVELRKEQKDQTVNITLTWCSSVNWLLAILETSTSERAREEARKQIRRMAVIADRHVQYVDKLASHE